MLSWPAMLGPHQMPCLHFVCIPASLVFSAVQFTSPKVYTRRAELGKAYLGVCNGCDTKTAHCHKHSRCHCWRKRAHDYPEGNLLRLFLAHDSSKDRNECAKLNADPTRTVPPVCDACCACKIWRSRLKAGQFPVDTTACKYARGCGTARTLQIISCT